MGTYLSSPRKSTEIPLKCKKYDLEIQSIPQQVQSVYCLHRWNQIDILTLQGY